MEMDVVKDIVDRQKLVRDRALERIKADLTNDNNEATKSLLLGRFLQLISANTYWEAQLGCLEAFCILLPHIRGQKCLENDKLTPWNDVIVKNLDCAESRVRKAAACSAGALVSACGFECYSFFRDLAVEKLKVFMVRQCDSSDERMDTDNSDQSDNDSLNDQTGRLSPVGGGSSDMVLHDTAGWRALESYMACLQNIMMAMAEQSQTEGAGAELELDSELIALVSQATEHRNRFVREMSYHVLSSLIAMQDVNKPNRTEFARKVSELIARGLSDNWSQVRMSASVVSRKLCQDLTRDNLYNLLPALLPPMCLNRYYIAEGVRLYSQETWRLVFEHTGRKVVCEHINDVIKFYVSQSEAENHAVREAVCACVTELVTKIDKDVLVGHVNTLLELLMICFDDDSWPVRDSACVATGFFVEAFPDECKSSADEIADNFYHNLTDNIPSVREGAAVALKKFCSVYPDWVEGVMEEMKKGLGQVANQEENSILNDGLEKGPATYSVVKQVHDNDPSLHENQVMYSCGSLAPKMKKGSSKRAKVCDKRPDTGGCMAHSFKRPGQPWEITDGFVLLLGEISSVNDLKAKIDNSITILIAKVFNYKHFTHHPKLFTTCYKVLAALFTNMGKMYTKRTLEMFLDGLFYGLSIDNKLAQCAAEDCFTTIAKIIGPNILKGRVENYDSKMLNKLHFVH